MGSHRRLHGGGGPLGETVTSLSAHWHCVPMVGKHKERQGSVVVSSPDGANPTGTFLSQLFN